MQEKHLFCFSIKHLSVEISHVDRKILGSLGAFMFVGNKEDNSSDRAVGVEEAKVYQVNVFLV